MCRNKIQFIGMSLWCGGVRMMFIWWAFLLLVLYGFGTFNASI